MNITSVNAAGSSGTGTTSSKSQNLQTIGTKGQVIDGLISKVSDKISINFSGKEVTVSKSAVQNAKEGEIRKFEIMDVSETSIVLKEVGNSVNTAATGIISTIIETDQAATKERLVKKEEESSSDEDDNQALEDISKRMTNQDYASLLKEGLYLEAYELTRLDRALERIKTQRDQKQDNLDSQVESQEERRNQVKKIIVGNLANSGMSSKIAEKLMDANLPITEENIVKITNAMQLAAYSTPIADKTMSYLIGNELEPTIENLYHGKYSGSVVQTKETDAAWEEIKNQAQTVLGKAGMDLSDANMEKARWLFQNQLPITEKSLSNLTHLQDLNQEMDADSVLDKIINAVSQGKTPEQASMGDNSYQLAKEAVDDFSKVTDQAIVTLVKSQQTINLNNLKAQTTQESNENAVTELNLSLLETADIDIKAVTAKRQLEEIRLKMTVEAGQKLIGKGIDLNTSDLQKVVEGLRELEDQYYQYLLKEGKLPDTEENVTLLRETTQKVNDLKYVPSYLLGTTLEQKSTQSLDTLAIAGNNLKSQMDKAGAAYETLMTAPRKDMGDSIEKAFRNVDNILKDLNMETTNANQRAVRILGYNGMEINEASIMNVKEYDAKVNYLMDNLHPAVTMELIKNGTNPLNIPIDQLNQQITQLKDELGVTEEEKYSKYLWKLEKSQGITEEERKSFIGIYRLLNNVEKTNGAAVGSVVQAQQDMTLKNLLTAVRTRKGNGVDQAVDDSFGELTSLTFQRETITEQIQTAYQTTDTTEYFNKIVEGLAQELAPEKLMNLEHNSLDTIMNQSIESLYEAIQSQDQSELDQEYYEDKVSQLRNMSENSKDGIELLNSFQIPTSLENLAAIKGVLEQGQSIFKEVRNRASKYSEQEQANLNQVMDDLSESLEDAQTMQQAYDKVEHSIQNILNHEYGMPTLTNKELADLKMLGNGIELAKNLSRQECYEIPIITGDSVTQINLTIVSGEQENGKVQVNLQSDQLGNIQAEFSVKNQSIKGYILCDNRVGMDTVSASEAQLEEKLKSLGLEVKQISTGINSGISALVKRPDNNKEPETATDTKTLYKVAKNFVQHVKEMEQSLILES